MKVSILSDLHIDKNREFPNVGEGNVLILAGDIFEIRCYAECKPILTDFFTQCQQNYDEVLFVAGNHEFYGSYIDESFGILRNLIPEKIHILENGFFDHPEGVRFVGSTFWTDFGNNPLYEWAAQRGMHDYKRIRKHGGPLLTSDIKKIHNSSLHWLETQLNENLGKPHVVITHHAPSFLSADPRYGRSNDDLTFAFMNRLDMMIQNQLNITHWVHGHIHHKSDYRIGNCRVMANPYGYRTYGENKDVEFTPMYFEL